MHSFDVFDTLITRTTREPAEIFYLMEAYLTGHRREYDFLPDELVYNFASLRIKAQGNAIKYYYNSQVKLKQIYRCLEMMTGIDYCCLIELEKLEVQFEIQNIIPIDENIIRLQSLMDKGEKVVLISDMYLGTDVIRSLLCGINTLFSKIPIYVSCDYNCTKADGSLYMLVSKEEHIDYLDWIHIGDNEFSDYLIPRMLGIKAQKYNLKNVSDGKSVSWQIGYRYGGEIFYSYVKWIEKICEIKKYKKVYFVARDGYVLKNISDLIKTDNACENHYLYFSRSVVSEPKKERTIAYLKQEGVDTEDSLIVDSQGTGRTFEKLAKWLGVRLNIAYYYLSTPCEPRKNNYYVYEGEAKGDIIELFTRAPHGITVDYYRSDEKWLPVFEKDYESEEFEKTINDYVRGACEYVKKVMLLQERNKVVLVSRKKSKELLDKCYLDPDKDVMNWLGDVYIDYNLMGHQYAPAISLEDVKKYYSNPFSYTGYCFDYSLRRLSEKDRENAEKIKLEMIRSLNKYICESGSENKTKIILYGAGKNAWRYVIKYGQDNKIDIVAWTDINVNGLIKTGLPLIGYRQAIVKRYDYIVIIIQSKKESVKRLIAETGVDYKRILFLEEFESYMEGVY